MKQLFCLMLFCASIFIVSCNKETADVTNSTGIETQKLSANSISLDEAKATYLKAAKEARSSVVGGTPLNLADFDPQWSQVDGSNFVDTSGNALTVPTTAFEPGGYKKLVFFRNNGQTTFLVATMLGTPEYLTRKNGICTMNDFCGFIIYTNLDGISTGGYKLDNGVTVGNLIPKTTPRPEWTFLDQLLDEFTVRSGPSGGGGRGSSAASFGLFNAMMFSNLTTFNNNTFGFGSDNSGSGSPDNSSMNGNAPPTVDKDNPLCPESFLFEPQKIPHSNPDNTIYYTIDNSTYTCGFKNLAFSVTYTKQTTGDVRTKIGNLANLFITMPAGGQGGAGGGGGLSTYASIAFATALSQTSAALSANNAGNINDIFSSFFRIELIKQDILHLAAHNSPSKSDSALLSFGTAEDKKRNFGTKFNENYTTCP
jgi:hypothetical protein